MILVLLVSLGVTIFVWVHFGVWWGLVAGFFLLTTPGIVLRRGWRSFVNAWELKLGDPKRSASAGEILAMNAVYRAWSNSRKQISAANFIEQHAQELETLGFHPRLKEDEVRILTGWSFEVLRCDKEGGSLGEKLGDHFRAARTFEWERGLPEMFGSATMPITQMDGCPHVHASSDEASPCLETLRRFTKVAPNMDFDHRFNLATTTGVYAHSENGLSARSEGSVALQVFGLAVPSTEGPRLIEWDAIASFQTDGLRTRMNIYGNDTDHYAEAVHGNLDDTLTWRALLTEGKVPQTATE